MIVVDTLTKRYGGTVAVDALSQSLTRCRPGIGLGDNPPPYLPASRLRVSAARAQNDRAFPEARVTAADQVERSWNSRLPYLVTSIESGQPGRERNSRLP